MNQTNINKLYCRYCSKECKNINSLKNHERCCRKNPNRNYKNGMLGKQAWNKGLTKETDERVAKGANTFLKNKLLGKHKDTSGENNSMKKFPEARNKISKTCLEKSKRGEWHTSLAKNNHYTYKGVDLDCTWELEYAKWLDCNNVEWIRPKTRFKYVYQNKEHYYNPDFYLPKTKEYIEVKGYATGKDYAKWKQFPKEEKLIILRKKHLKKLGIKVK